MNELTDKQADFLTEICNVGIGRAASQLSILLNDHVEITVPSVAITRVSGLSSALKVDADEIFVIVHQRMSGMLQGCVALVFDQAASKILVEQTLLGMAGVVSVQLDLYRREAMIEIGNIIISSSVSVLADFVRNEVELSVPSLSNKTITDLLCGVDPDVQTVLVMSTVLESNNHCVTGIILYALDTGGLSDLLKAIDNGDLGAMYG